jgi:type II secretory pathway pseudopilin PulG
MKMGWIALILAGGIFLLFLFNRPKETLGCVGVFILIIVVLVGWYVNKTNEDSAREEAQRAAQQRIEAAQKAKIAEQEEKVQISVIFDPRSCRQDHPLHTFIMNGSSQTVVKTEWSFDVYRVGFSAQLARDHSFTTDRIIKPGERYAICCSQPELQLREAVPYSQLDWRIATKSVTFQELKQELGQ